MKIKEEDKIHEEWYKEAEDMSIDKLPVFLNHLMNDYEHDYGTIVHAMTAGAIATTWAMDKEKQGGITGGQAMFLMWNFIRNWMCFGKIPLKLIKYSDMLYPQYEAVFEKTMSKSTWGWLQKEAKERIEKTKKEYVSGVVFNHWKKMVNGEIPFGYKVIDDD